jgi:hypothetical protein
VAAHSWGIAGAANAGCATAFVARPGKALNPLGPKADISGAELREVADHVLRQGTRMLSLDAGQGALEPTGCEPPAGIPQPWDRMEISPFGVSGSEATTTHSRGDLPCNRPSHC